MKKSIILTLIIIFFLCALAGCVQTRQGNIFMAANEIFTYTKIDPEKTQIIISRIGNIPVEQLCTAFEERNPDIQVIYTDITGGDSKYAPVRDWIKNGDAPDVLISGGTYFDAEQTSQYFVNLSDNPIIKKYEAAALQRTAINSNVYFLPGPSDISAIMYNKTLFDTYGWKLPANFDEFVSLCDQIRQDTNGEIEPWNPNAKYGNELITIIEAMTYEETLAGLENRTWYNDFLDGNATFSGHMEPYFAALQTLIDHELLREEHLTYSATTRGKEFSAGKIAMLNGQIYNADNEQFDFDFMPFPSTVGSMGYLCDSYNCFVGVPIKEHTEAQNEAIYRFLDFFSSAEGQEEYIGSSMKISNLKDSQLSLSANLLSLKPLIDAGHLFGRFDFWSSTSRGSKADLHGMASKMIIGEMTGAECIAYIDAKQLETESAPPVESQEPLVTVSKNMTILETSCFYADCYRTTADADIGLITDNEIFRGNVMRMYAGDITPDMVTVLKPRSFANDTSLIKVSMTGQQIIDALNAPVGNEQVANCIYAFSGLKCEVAPWNELGSKYLSIKLEDGSQVQPEKLYTVAIWAGTVADEYITETLNTYDKTWEEIMTSYLESIDTIAPFDDGRIKLFWE